MGKCVFLPQIHIKTPISSKVNGLECVYVWGQGKRLLVELPAGVVSWVTALDVPCFLLHEVFLTTLDVESVCGLMLQAATIEVIDGGVVM